MTLEELNLTCERLEAAQACRNLVGKLSYFDSAFRTNDLIDLWADTDQTALTLNDKTQGLRRRHEACELPYRS